MTFLAPGLDSLRREVSAELGAQEAAAEFSSTSRGQHGCRQERYRAAGATKLPGVETGLRGRQLVFRAHSWTGKLRHSFLSFLTQRQLLMARCRQKELPEY